MVATRYLFGLLATVVLLFGLCPRSDAAVNIVTGDTIRISVNNTGSNNPSTTNHFGDAFTYRATTGGANKGEGGGEFFIQETTGIGGSLVGDKYKTFCLERNESITLPGDYYVSVDSAASGGGISGGSPDPLGLDAAWLYAAYANNVLPGLVGSSVYQYGVDADAGDLQAALWYLEGELSSVSGDALTLVNLAIAADKDVDDDGFFDYNVKVLNLWGNAARTQAKQSQYILLEGRSDIPVPEPTTLLIWGGIVGLGLVASRRRR